MATEDVRQTTVEVNGAELYHEIRGGGPPLLFISGAGGDAGCWTTGATTVADVLADRYRVVTYDRRGNSRSPAPAGWGSTSTAEQADDAAALIEALGLGPTTVVGTSGGAVITLALLERHPEVLRAAVVHEPPLRSLLPDAGEAPEPGPAGPPSGGDLRAAFERFLRVVCEDDVFESLEPGFRKRMLGNAQVFFEMELFGEVFTPDIDRLRGCGVPLAVAAGRDTKGHSDIGFLYQASANLAEALGLPLHEVAGKHVPYFTHPESFSAELRRILEELESHDE